MLDRKNKKIIYISAVIIMFGIPIIYGFHMQIYTSFVKPRYTIAVIIDDYLIAREAP